VLWKSIIILDFMRHGEDNRGRCADNLAGRHSIWTINAPTSIIPQFYAGCPSCRNPPNLCWLGTGTKYAGLHSRRPVESITNNTVNQDDTKLNLLQQNQPNINHQTQKYLNKKLNLYN